MKINKLLLLLFATVFMNAFIWLILVPIWHTPDEQAHFGQVAFFAEKKRNPNGSENDLTEEIYISEKLLGTARDKLGNNKFTFHPDYRIEYTTSYEGKYEASISALAKTASPRKFVYLEASRYPILYYIPAAFIYRLFLSSDLFVRIFVVRFWSLLLFLATVYVCFLLGKLLFPKNRLLSLTLPILVGFQPMMIFANVGVNSDALGNLLFTIFLYLSFLLLIFGFSSSKFLQALLAIILSVYTKPQFIITVPLFLILLIFIIFRDICSKKKYLFFLVLLSLTLMVISLIYKFKIGPIRLIDKISPSFNAASLVKFTREYTISHTYREVLPWYWGVYNWLGVTYPRSIHRIINRICLFSGIGFLVYLINVLKSKTWKDKRFQAVIFFILLTLFYFGGISFYDWLLWYTSKYPLGVQGRYFFPLISTHMFILLLGWIWLFPRRKKLRLWGAKILAIMMISLNFYALFTVAKIYYDISKLQFFLWQVSQYKPWFFKGNWLILLGLSYFIILVSFLIQYIGWQNEKKI